MPGTSPQSLIPASVTEVPAGVPGSVVKVNVPVRML